MIDNLTRKQRAFIEFYLETWNATRSAERAGYKHPNMAGPRMMVKDSIKAAIEQRLKDQQIVADEILKRLTDQAQLNPSDFFIFDEEGSFEGINWKVFRERGHLIKKLNWVKDRPVLEFHDVQKALELLGKANGALTDRLDVTNGTITLKVVYDDKDIGQS